MKSFREPSGRVRLRRDAEGDRALKPIPMLVFLALVQMAPLSFAQSVTLKVPGTSQLILAGSPSGSTIDPPSGRDPFGLSGTDRAPANSPVVVDLRLSAGQAIQFAASGSVDLSTRLPPEGNPSLRFAGPNGTSVELTLGTSAGHGSIGEMSAHHGSLIGLFENLPEGQSPPANFLSAAETITVLEPRVNQPFLIGDGKTPAGVIRTIIVPARANRLFLGIADTLVSDNGGEFSVSVSVVPRPSPSSQATNPLVVLGTSQIMLAGLIGGKTWIGRDAAPLASPGLINLQQFQTDSVRISVTGTVDLDSKSSSPPGGTGTNVSYSPNGPLGDRFPGSGFSGIDAPRGSLIGAFVAGQFDTDINLAFQSDFSTSALRNVTPLTVRLQQLFYIGDGRTDAGAPKDFVIPAGATRLFLGIHVGDFQSTSGNYGAFVVTVSPNSPATPRLPQAGAISSISHGSLLSPGSVVVISGASFAQDNVVADRQPLPTQLGGTKLLFDLIEAPLFTVSPAQITAQVPLELTSETAQLVVSRDGIPSVPITVQLAAYSPGIISLDGRSGLVWKASTGELVGASLPARAGESLSLYATGLGPVDTPVPSGSSPPPDTPVAVTSPVSVILGGIQTAASFAGLAPGLVGIYQVNFAVPDGVGNGLRPLQIQVAGAVSISVLLPVQN